jgi:hypothetical protein
MEKQKNGLKVRLTTIVLCILVILLFTAPCGAQLVDIGETVDIDYAIEGDYLMVLGTANLYPGAYIDWGIYAATGCEINVYGGEIGDGFLVMLYTGEPVPIVTVYGTDFKLDDKPIDPQAGYFITGPSGFGILTGTYENGDPIDLMFLSDVPIYLESPDAGMTIDVKPGDEQNNINLNSKGVVPVAVMTTEQFDAAELDPATALFAGASPERWKLEDIDGDGKDDLLLHFRTQELELDQDSTEATLAALTVPSPGPMTMANQSAAQVSTGLVVSGTDEVRIIVSKKSKK